MTVSTERFEEQMRYLKENGYESVSLDDLLNHLENGTGLPEPGVIITIDDGWSSTYHLARPILKRYGFSATLFIYTDFIGASEKALTWEMIKELQNDGFDIQCHSKTHRNFVESLENVANEETQEILRMELYEPRRILKSQLGVECKYLAYPYGATDELSTTMTREAGYRAAFTVHRGLVTRGMELFRLNRSMIYGQHDIGDFRRQLTYRPSLDQVSNDSR